MIWEIGRALVFAEDGEVEYFLRFEDRGHLAGEGPAIRTICGGLRPGELCRPLDYVLPMHHLRRMVRKGLM